MHHLIQTKWWNILTADRRGHTLTFCLTDSGQTKDAFASRKRHAIEWDITVWLHRMSPLSRWENSPCGREHDIHYPATVGRIVVWVSLRFINWGKRSKRHNGINFFKKRRDNSKKAAFARKYKFANNDKLPRTVENS